MSRYIDADALLKTINSDVAEAHNERCAQILEAILYAPPADVVEVVRCKNCKYWHSPKGDDTHYCCLDYGLQGLVAEEDFCSYGKRSENGT